MKLFHSNKDGSTPFYRRDIDGLRALAILAVVIYHALPSWLPGGFIGVDIFFVISGFLISGIIFRELNNSNFSVIEFYKKRIKRIFPSLILVLIGCYLVGLIFLLPDEFLQLSKHIAAGASFVQNFILQRELGYFDIASEQKPLLHLWSLSIEEQFYLLYPLLILFAWRMRLSPLLVISTCTTMSFALNVFGVLKNPSETFFLPHTRFWELLLGSALAWLQFCEEHHRSPSKLLSSFRTAEYSKAREDRAANTRKLLNNAPSILGVFILVFALFFINKNDYFPGWRASIPVLGTLLIISAGAQSWANLFIFSNSLMVFVGLISYPLYLWHWPALSFLRIITSGKPSEGQLVCTLFMSFIIAFLTYFFIERPIRFGMSLRSASLFLSVGLAAVGFLGYKTYKYDFLSQKVLFIPAQILKVSKASGTWEYPGEMLPVTLDGTSYYILPSHNPNFTLFVGDSNIEQYFPRLKILIKNEPDNSNGIIFKTGGGCLPIPLQPHDRDHRHCCDLIPDAMKILRTKREIDTVVIGAQWNGYLAGSFGLQSQYYVGSATYIEALNVLSDYLKELRSLERRVFLVLNIPTSPKLDPKYIIRRDFKSFPKFFSIRDNGVRRDELEKDFGQIQSDLARIARDSGAIVIDPKEFLCTPECCFGLDENGDAIYKDSSHLNPTFTRDRASFIDVTIKH